MFQPFRVKVFAPGYVLLFILFVILVLGAVFLIRRKPSKIRTQLVLSYAGIALLVSLSLGAVLLVTLRAYYGGMEQDYLYSNAKAIGGLAVPMLVKMYPKDLQDAQVSNLAFLSQTRVRILDQQRNVLADSGPWQSPQVGLGVMRTARISVAQPGGPPDKAAPSGSSSVIIIQKGSSSIVSAVPGPAAGSIEESSRPVEKPSPGGGPPNVLYFNTDIPVTNGVYGLYLSRPSAGPAARSDQVVQEPILDSSGTLLGYVELSESPAYGREIVNSVAAGLAVAGGLAILLAVGAGWLTSRRFTAPLSSLREATQQMSGGDLSVRVVGTERADEFGILGKSFNQMAGRIEETVQTLRRFLADAAHELQTPLTALRTNLELARSEQNSAETETYLTHALDQIDRLQRLIKDLLNLSRLESAPGLEALQPVDLADLVRQASEPFAARAEQAGQSFDLELPAGEALVRGSPEKLCGALANLLDNALKFTPAGGAVTICLRDAVQGAIDGFALTVADTGIGIPPEEIPMLFNRFHRGRNAATYPGSGLGLAIVRAIAQAHGGSVQAANNPRGGANFTLFLPRAGAAQ